ncbi:MAG: DUF1254 domain-containing protein [Candidatus Obscuribacterales bacterium]|nr:DUF1254 domain-containing protein [Candidatus Obscuribacterales bacterium]
MNSISIKRIALAIFSVTLVTSGDVVAQPETSDRAKRPAVLQNAISEKEAYSIGREAYSFFYPLITMDITRKQCTNLAPGQKPGFGPANLFSHMRAYPNADFKTVVRPNFDTLYSPAWLDLTEEPMIVSAPDTDGRYYLLPMLDMWSDVIAAPGWRTSGTTAKNFLVAPPSWTGTLPTGCERIIAPTPYLWIIGRTKTDGPNDYAAVNKIQDGYTITPLSSWGKKTHALVFKIDPTIEMKTPPLEQVNNLNIADYLAYAARLMKLHPAHVTDWSIISRLQRIGFVPGQDFDASKLPQTLQAALQRGATDELKLMVATLPKLGRPINGWSVNADTMGVYGNYYLKRAAVAMAGLGANQPEDAIYPLNNSDASGKPLDGSKNYVLHFGAQELPPVDAFWSLTVYDKDGFQCANSIKRFAISSWMPLVKNSDGSLDIYIQHNFPGPNAQLNWLPAPADSFNVCMRLYAPKLEALTGKWNPPVIIQAK